MEKEENVTIVLHKPDGEFKEYEVARLISVNGENLSGGVSSFEDLFKEIKHYVNRLKDKEKRATQEECDCNCCEH